MFTKDIDPADLYASVLTVTPVDRDWSEGWGETWQHYDAPNCTECVETCRHTDGPDLLEFVGIDAEDLRREADDAEEVAEEARNQNGPYTEPEARRLVEVADKLTERAEAAESIEGETWEAWRCADPKCDGFGQEADDLGDGPMMNYAYPLESLRGTYGEHEFPTTVMAAAQALAGLPLCIVERLEDDGYELALTGGGMDLSWDICEAFMRLGFLPPVHFCDLPNMCKSLTFKPYAIPADPGPRPEPRPENVARFPLLMRASVMDWETRRERYEWAVENAPAIDAAQRETVARNRAIVAACKEAVRQHAEHATKHAERVTESLDRLAV